MSKTLKQFQHDRLSDIGEFYQQAILPSNSAFTTRTCIVDGPTGSGKTVIVAEAIKKFFKDAFVLVLSPGAGNLDAQTQDVLKEGLAPEGFHVDKLKTTDLKHGPRPRTVRVVNWQSVASFDKKTGDYTPILTRFGGEDADLFDFLRKKGCPVIIVIDEAHHGKGVSAKSIPLFLASVREALGYTPMVFEFSATPAIPNVVAESIPSDGSGPGLTIVKRDGELYGYTQTTFDEAVDAGLLRRRTLLNDGVKEVVEKWSAEEALTKVNRRFLVESALRKQRVLRDMYAKRGISVWPLIGIQIPNSTEGNVVQADIIDYLAHLPQHIEGEEAILKDEGLAIYLQGDKSAVLDGIDSHSSQVRVLLYKTAVATGWNCPRAQILVGFRALNSAQFSIQNRGRFLRTLEGKHYEEDGASPLDWAYIYADVPTMGGLTGEKNDSATEDVRLMANPSRLAQYNAFGLPLGGLERSGQDTVDRTVIRARLEHFYSIFENKFDEDYADLSKPQNRRLIEAVEDAHGEGFLQTAETEVPDEVDIAPLQKQVQQYITGAFTSFGKHYPERSYDRNARVAEAVTNAVISILQEKPKLLAAADEQNAPSFESFIIPKVSATPRMVREDGVERLAYDLRAPGAVALRDWVRAVFTNDDAPAPVVKRNRKGEEVVKDAKKPVEPTPLAEGASRDQWKPKFTGSHVAPTAALATRAENGSNVIKGDRAAKNLYAREDGTTLPIGSGLTDTEVAFEEFLVSLTGRSDIADVWFSKSSTGASAAQLPVVWEKDGVTKATRLFPDYFGVITFTDGTSKPFLFEVKSANPEGMDGKNTGVTQAKAEALARYASRTGALAAVVYPRSAANAEWEVFRAVEANRAPLATYISAAGQSPMRPFTKYPFAVKSYDEVPAEFSWMVETIQL